MLELFQFFKKKKTFVKQIDTGEKPHKKVRKYLNVFLFWTKLFINLVKN